jgi:hypothetical protein
VSHKGDSFLSLGGSSPVLFSTITITVFITNTTLTTHVLAHVERVEYLTKRACGIGSTVTVSDSLLSGVCCVVVGVSSSMTS